MFRFLLALSPLYIWLAWMRHKYPLNPYECILIYGKPGTGKTVDIVYNCLKDLREGWTPYVNIHLNIPGVRYFDTKDFGKFKFEPHSRVYIDEVGIIWNSRDYKSFDKNKREFCKLYRHNQISLIMYSQSNDVDVTLRRICSSEFIMSKFLYWTVKRKLRKNLKILPPEECHNADEQLINYLEKESLLTPGAVKIYFQPTYYGYADTYEMPPYPDYPYEMQHGEIRHRPTMKALHRQHRKEMAAAHATKKKNISKKRFKILDRGKRLQGSPATE